MLSDLEQFNKTGQFEIYCALYNKYCVKWLHFSWNGMAARTELAILDHNSERACAQTNGGNQC